MRFLFTVLVTFLLTVVAYGANYMDTVSVLKHRVTGTIKFEGEVLTDSVVWESVSYGGNGTNWGVLSYGDALSFQTKSGDVIFILRRGREFSNLSFNFFWPCLENRFDYSNIGGIGSCEYAPKFGMAVMYNADGEEKDIDLDLSSLDPIISVEPCEDAVVYEIVKSYPWIENIAPAFKMGGRYYDGGYSNSTPYRKDFTSQFLDAFPDRFNMDVN